MISGLLLIDKPEGPTSARVVQRVKSLLGADARKVGHLGSLDPFASGLLLVGVNEGTKVAEIYLNERKSYSGVIGLGVSTDTDDRTGAVLEVKDVPEIHPQQLEELQKAFTGLLKQIPPMYSALKRNGVPLYRLAREGKTVPRSPRSIVIETLNVSLLNRTQIGFEVVCSKGTYIRTLAADMGATLGCGGHLLSLRRLSCGPFTVDQAFSLERLRSIKDETGTVPLVPLAGAVRHLRQISLEDQEASLLRSGRQERLRELDPPGDHKEMVCLNSASGEPVALARWVERGGDKKWQLFRVFVSSGDP